MTIEFQVILGLSSSFVLFNYAIYRFHFRKKFIAPNFESLVNKKKIFSLRNCNLLQIQYTLGSNGVPLDVKLTKNESLQQQADFQLILKDGAIYPYEFKNRPFYMLDEEAKTQLFDSLNYLNSIYFKQRFLIVETQLHKKNNYVQQLNIVMKYQYADIKFIKRSRSKQQQIQSQSNEDLTIGKSEYIFLDQNNYLRCLKDTHVYIILTDGKQLKLMHIAGDGFCIYHPQIENLLNKALNLTRENSIYIVPTIPEVKSILQNRCSVFIIYLILDMKGMIQIDNRLRIIFYQSIEVENIVYKINGDIIYNKVLENIALTNL